MQKQWSYWELDYFEGPWDVAVIGAGFTGCSVAYHLKTEYPKLKIAVIDRAFPGEGASTKNAGFACFGSVSELEADLKQASSSQVVSLVKQRYAGIQLMRNIIGDKQMQYKQSGAYEIFPAKTIHFDWPFLSLDYYQKAISEWNKKLEYGLPKPAFIQEQYLSLPAVYMPNEGMLNPLETMRGWYKLLSKMGVGLLFGINVNYWIKHNNNFKITVDNGAIYAKKLAVCTNGLTHLFRKSLNLPKVVPARNQVCILKGKNKHCVMHPVHFGEGYYYFRPLDEYTLLFGGARYLDETEETTSEFKTNQKIVNHLNTMAQHVFQNWKFETTYVYQGILGVGNQKTPIVKQIEPNVYGALRLGGMGVALSTLIGKQLAKLITSHN